MDIIQGMVVRISPGMAEYSNWGDHEFIVSDHPWRLGHGTEVARLIHLDSHKRAFCSYITEGLNPKVNFTIYNSDGHPETYKVFLIGETPKNYRIQAITPTQVGKNRILYPRLKSLVKKDMISIIRINVEERWPNRNPNEGHYDV